MHGNRLRYAFLLFAVFALVGYSGCILSPDEEQPQPQPKPTYKPLTDKENIIYNLMQCYKEHNINRFVELLHENYMWYNQVGSAKEYFLRTEDIDKTGKMFQAAERTYSDPDLWLDKLELKIYDGTWTVVPEFEGAACVDCWETTRTYEITAQLNGGATTYVGYDDIRFIVVGVDKGGQRIYQIRRADDMKKPNQP